MSANPTCPKCGKLVRSASGTPITVNVGLNKYKGVAYSCSLCSAVFSVDLDPLALKTDIINGIKPHIAKAVDEAERTLQNEIRAAVQRIESVIRR